MWDHERLSLSCFSEFVGNFKLGIMIFKGQSIQMVNIERAIYLEKATQDYGSINESIEISANKVTNTILRGAPADEGNRALLLNVRWRFGCVAALSLLEKGRGSFFEGDVDSCDAGDDLGVRSEVAARFRI